MSDQRNGKKRDIIDIALSHAIESIADHLEVRANDPWPDHLWPQASEILCLMAAEIRENKEELIADMCEAPAETI